MLLGSLYKTDTAKRVGWPLNSLSAPLGNGQPTCLHADISRQAANGDFVRPGHSRYQKHVPLELQLKRGIWDVFRKSHLPNPSLTRELRLESLRQANATILWLLRTRHGNHTLRETRGWKDFCLLLTTQARVTTLVSSLPTLSPARSGEPRANHDRPEDAAAWTAAKGCCRCG